MLVLSVEERTKKMKGDMNWLHLLSVGAETERFCHSHHCSGGDLCGQRAIKVQRDTHKSAAAFLKLLCPLSVEETQKTLERCWN